MKEAMESGQCRHMQNSIPGRAENQFKDYRQEHAGHCGGTGKRPEAGTELQQWRNHGVQKVMESVMKCIMVIFLSFL